MSVKKVHTQGRKAKKGRGFTLVELLITIGILGTLSAFVLIAVNPTRFFGLVADSGRKNTARQIRGALQQYLIENGSAPHQNEIPIEASEAKMICAYGITTNVFCLNFDSELVPTYLSEIPRDDAEPCPDFSGYRVYRPTDPDVVSDHLGSGPVATSVDEACSSVLIVTQDGNSNSQNPHMSYDGRYISFETNASNLITGDTNGVQDVLVFDRVTRAYERVSVSSAGTQSNGSSSYSFISADGRYVVFSSNATNLVSGDTNFASDIFLHDRDTDTTTRVSVSSVGTQSNGGSYAPTVSGDGRYITYYSDASNLVAGDTNGQSDVFLYDTTTAQTTRINVTSGGTQAVGGTSNFPYINSDGTVVAYSSLANNLVPGDTYTDYDMFSYDIATGVTTRESVTSGGAQATGPGAGAQQARFSADGRYLAFISSQNNLVAGDTNGYADIFVRDRQTGQNTRVSVSTSGVQSNGTSFFPTITADGRYVGFTSQGTSLVSSDTNGTTLDVFVHDMQASTTTLLALSVFDEQLEAGALTRDLFLSGDGRFAVFNSNASNLVENDTLGFSDIFQKYIGSLE